MTLPQVPLDALFLCDLGPLPDHSPPFVGAPKTIPQSRACWHGVLEPQENRVPLPPAPAPLSPQGVFSGFFLSGQRWFPQCRAC